MENPFKNLNLPVKENEPLKNHTTFQIGGPARYFIELSETEDLIKALKAAKENNLPYWFIGGGSNLLIADKGLQGLTVHLSSPEFRQIALKGAQAVAGGALGLSALLQFLIQSNRGECEFLYGVPAQVGGAVFMNAGGAGRWEDA